MVMPPIAVMSDPTVKPVRPTKKQRELLTFIDEFIRQHGYSPSFREIMTGCNYTSVATVSLHVNNLITRGHLRKKDRSARSLEVVSVIEEPAPIATNDVSESEEKWLVGKIDYRFRQLEDSKTVSQVELDSLYVLLGALKVLGLDGAAQSFMPRLGELKKRLTTAG
jgi:SOS-response transcriptional repressor LexA